MAGYRFCRHREWYFSRKSPYYAHWSHMALPISGLLLAALVFAISLLFIPLMGIKEPNGFIFIGIYWVVLTLTFEFGFGYFVLGKSWREILQVFDFTKGDLFVVVLCATAVSPCFAVKIRGIF